jgi:hypothetical protein
MYFIRKTDIKHARAYKITLLFDMGNGRKSTLRLDRRPEMMILNVFLMTMVCVLGICGLILGV